MFFKILPIEDKDDKIVVSKKFIDENFMNSDHRVKVKAGMRFKDAELIVSAGVKEEIVKMSMPLIEYLSLPTDGLYQVIGGENTIQIGPVIGLLFAYSDEYLTKDGLRICLGYTRFYEQYKGLLCLMSFDGIDFDNNTVEGYYYKPSGNAERGNWEKGYFPMPEVIYRRIPLGRSGIAQLRKAIENRIINPYYFTKWSFWKMVSASEVLSSHVPYTCLFDSIKDLDNMLEKYGTVYLKPVNGSKASGLIRVKRDGDYYFEENDCDHPTVVEPGNAVDNYINRIKQQSYYMVQQAINSLKLGDRIVDFRVAMQKDEKLKWQCTAIVAKVGRINGICSNFRAEGYSLNFETALKRSTSLCRQEISDKKQELIDVCINVCNALDAAGESYGDFGIDAAIDESLNIWIFEVNKEQDFSILHPIYNGEKYLAIISNPTKYAVGLTDFKLYES